MKDRMNELCNIDIPGIFFTACCVFNVFDVKAYPRFLRGATEFSPTQLFLL
jgi:hypothetical protein